MPHCLILGGTRSGKSRYAEQLAQNSGREVAYIATAQAHDNAMQERIQLHRQTRPTQWQTHEEPLALAACLKQLDNGHTLILVDCLTLWISNLLCHDDHTRLSEETQALFTTLTHLKSPVIMVSNETGLGIIPLGELTRRYVDHAGFVHQQLAAQLDTVIFVVAGLPNVLKGNPAWNG